MCLHFRRSLKYCDLRLIDSSFLTRTALEQEVGVACSYVTRGIIPDTMSTAEKGVELKEEEEDELESSRGGMIESDELPLEPDRPPSNGSATTRASGQTLRARSLTNNKQINLLMQNPKSTF